ncbi:MULTISPECIES: sigma-70 family RNA polymerase sigma factor [unclassified Streptomyces]|uniref:sigma-70 family RNA polymerase sigma factor n=1 Tax=unclassified Streptomyces TaxID=2593676 RepID=UPI00380BF789
MDRPALDTSDRPETEAVFLHARGMMFGIAYRMLCNVSEAEDVLQEAWIRWQTCDRSRVENPEAFLTTTVTRLAINVLQSARVRRESYVGMSLPEPVDTLSDPEVGFVSGETLAVAVLVLLERLTPVERAAYVLREAFDYPYGQIADLIGHSEVNTRQLVSRARKRLAARKRTRVTAEVHQRFLTAFLVAARTGDVAVLERVLTEDAAPHSDGGPLRAPEFPSLGSHRVA